MEKTFNINISHFKTKFQKNSHWQTKLQNYSLQRGYIITLERDQKDWVQFKITPEWNQRHTEIETVYKMKVMLNDNITTEQFIKFMT